ncbi:MAG: RNA-binding protein [Neomegalonema sp.]|nr:RNA-binding protein [Neomegalonema sp.]
MTRGGRPKEREAPERRCAATGETSETAQLIRFVISPEGVATPDLAEKLPGRGVWVKADRAALTLAVKRNAFARSIKGPATAPADLLERTETLLLQRLIQSLALCRKAGLAVAGYEKAREALMRGNGGAPPEALLQASDGSEDGRRKIRRLADDLPVIDVLKKEELGLAFGRPYVIHAVLMAGGIADRAIREASRLEGVRAVAST